MNLIYRYVVLFVSLLYLTLLIAHSAVFNFTVICMKENEAVDEANETNANQELSTSEQSVLFGVIAVGRILGSLPAVKLMEIFGFKASCAFFGILSAVGTVSVPLLEGGFYPLLAHRFIQGFAVAAVFVAYGRIPNEIGKKEERNMFLSLLTSSMQMGPVLIMPVAGLFCSSQLGWKGSYYLISFVTASFSVIFFFAYKTIEEMKAGNDFCCSGSVNILSNKTHKIFSVSEKSVEPANETVPYKAILLTPSFWGLLLVSFGDIMGYHMFLLYGPIYLNKILGFDVTQTGFLAATPYLFSIATKVVGGHFLDKATCIKESLKIVLFTFLSQAAMTACFVMLTQITSNMPFVGQSMFTLIMVFSGLAFIGLMNGNRIISQQFGHITSSAISIQGGIAALSMPVLVALIAPNYNRDEWTMVFYLIIGLMIATNVSFVAITKVKPAEWTKPKPIDYGKLSSDLTLEKPLYSLKS